MKIKIIFAQNTYQDEVINWGNIHDTLTDWEDIEDEDFELLRRNIYKIIPEKYANAGFNPKILVKDEMSVSDMVKTIKDLVQKEKDAIKKAEDKRKEAKIKRQMANDAKRKLTEKEVYETLKEKFEKGKN